jgi:hypothetical protein
MRQLILVAALFIAAAAWAYQPVAVQKSAVEQQLAESLEKATADSGKVLIARTSLDAHADDIAAGRAAQDILLRHMEDPVAFFKARAEQSNSVAAHYLYARAADDSLVMAQEATWILAHDPKSYWGEMLSGDAEYAKENPDLGTVKKHYMNAIALDPSRPEGYLFLGYAFEDDGKWQAAREAFEAGAVSDPGNSAIRDQRLTTYAELRDANAFFDLTKGQFPDRPVDMDLQRANKPGRLTTKDLLGKQTVIEYWAYT